MRLCILGATGNSGRRLVAQALARGHEVTALVRASGPMAAAPNLTIRQVDYADRGALQAALGPHDCVVNAAGNVADGARFTDLVALIIEATAAALGQGGRFWLFGGAAVLNVPDARWTGIDLPGVPPMYQAHRTNHEAVKASGLDWSMLCPGPMIDAPDGKATPGLILSEEVWPVPRPKLTYALPRLATTVAFVRAVPRMTIYYEDAATVILDHLEPKGRFARKRVGVALPGGERRHKPAG
jgi:hypothetical protein